MNSGRINSNIIHCKSAHYLEFFEITWIWLSDRAFAKVLRGCAQGEKRKRQKIFPRKNLAPTAEKKHGNRKWMGNGTALFAVTGVIGRMAFSARGESHA